MTLPVQGNDSADVRSMEVVSMTDLGKEVSSSFSFLIIALADSVAAEELLTA